MERLDPYTAAQLSEFLTDGSLEAVLQDDSMIAVIDQKDVFALGEVLHCSETGQSYTIGARLRHVSLDGRPVCFYGNETCMKALHQSERLPADIHIYLDKELKDEQYNALCDMLPTLVYDPHASYTNQRDNIQSRDDSGVVSAKAATAMNALICSISVLSVFLLHTQNTLNRREEFSLLSRLGCSDGQLRLLLYLEGYLIVAVGLLIFALLYGWYVGSVMAAIRETDAYQYSGFTLAWREIIIIASGIAVGIGLSGVLSDPDHRKKEVRIV